jgi:hypothetical protein
LWTKKIEMMIDPRRNLPQQEQSTQQQQQEQSTQQLEDDLPDYRTTPGSGNRTPDDTPAE